MATVTFDNATLTYPGAQRPSVDHLNLEVADGEFLVLVGPSGCGKSTTLRMLAGLEEVSEGSIRIGDKDVTDMAPKDRDIAMVFQNYALYPHMSVRQNMGFALKLSGASKDEINSRVEEAAVTLGLSDLLDRKPKELSGGQRQRVAMGRAIVRSPQVFLMDEPLSNLDAKLRVQTRTQIAALQRKLAVTTVYVTHDQTEALTMGDRIAVLNDGTLQQVGTPRELYDAPANVFVAGFIGSPAMNLATYQVASDGVAHNSDSHIELPGHVVEQLRHSGEDKVVVGFRPEAVELVYEGADTTGAIAFVIDFVEELGSDAYIYGHHVGTDAERHELDVTDLTETNDIVVRTAPNSAPTPGSKVFGRINPQAIHVFSAATGERLLY